MRMGLSRRKKIILACAGVFAAALVLLLCLPCTCYMRRAVVHMLPKIDQYPIFHNREVAAGDPQPWPFAAQYGSVAIDGRYIDRFAELGTVAFAVVRRDSLLFEGYWDGYGPLSHSNSFSMAKSVVSMLVGVAIEEGLIEDVNQPVADFLPDYGDFDGKPLTIEHLLTMSAGVEWDENYSGLFSKTTEAYYGNDLPRLMRRVKQVAEPGVSFKYQSGVTQLLAMVLEKATGKTLSEYASEKIWTPIGAEDAALWSLDRKGGHEKAYCCFNSNARDFARLGQLMLRRGNWKGRQLVPEWYMDRAMSPAGWLTGETGAGPNRTYGFQFWILQKGGMTIPYMRGINGQVVFAIPEKDAVIVRLGHKRSDVRTAQNYPDDIDTWLDAGLEIMDTE